MPALTIQGLLLAVVALTSPTMSSTFSSGHCPAGDSPNDVNGWTEFGQSCYRWFNSSQQAWYPAELACRSHGGHLASIGSDQENRLIGRLTGCRDAWIGRYASDYHRVTDPDSYEWTDGSSSPGYSRHNFSQSVEPHMGAVLAEGLAWVNSHYHEPHSYVCEVPSSAGSGAATGCAPPYAQFRGDCYWMSDFEASFVEASLHCERELAGRVASLRNPEALKFVGTLELDTDACELGTVWLGLIKQNPCRPVTDALPGPCYQWTDHSGVHAGFPTWAPGHPLMEDWTVNCACLTGDSLRSEKCHARHRFLCERPSNSTAGGAGGADEAATVQTAMVDNGV